MSDSDHDELREATGLYVLGALDADERARVEAHLRGCEECAAEVRSLRQVAHALPYGVTQVDPASALRQRVLAAVGAKTAPKVVAASARPRAVTAPASADAPAHGRGFWAGWLSAAAMALVAAGAGIYAANLKSQLDDVELRLVDAVVKLQASEDRVAAASAQVTAIRASLALVTAPDVLDLRLAGQRPSPRANGRAFHSRSRGLLFAASDLPPLPPDRVYQLWLLTRGAPVSAGLFRPDPQGNVTAAFDPIPDAPVPVGFAVSLEPEGGVPAPTGAIYLATQ